MTNYKPWRGVFYVATWVGNIRVRCRVLGETRRSYRVELLRNVRLPRRHDWSKAGDVVTVPKSAMKKYPEARNDCR